MDSATHPLDICECGDYRRDHDGEIGRCRLPNDLTHGFKECHRFRLSRTAEEDGVRQCEPSS